MAFEMLPDKKEEEKVADLDKEWEKVPQSLQELLPPKENIPHGLYNSKCQNKADMNNLRYFCGSKFMLHWTFTNSSDQNMSWPALVTFKQVAGDDFEFVPFKIDRSIDSGNSMDIFVNLSTPTKPGLYHGFFRLCYGPQDIEFGEKVWIYLTAEDKKEQSERKESFEINQELQKQQQSEMIVMQEAELKQKQEAELKQKQETELKQEMELKQKQEAERILQLQ